MVTSEDWLQQAETGSIASSSFCQKLSSCFFVPTEGEKSRSGSSPSAVNHHKDSFWDQVQWSCCSEIRFHLFSKKNAKWHSFCPSSVLSPSLRLPLPHLLSSLFSCFLSSHPSIHLLSICSSIYSSVTFVSPSISPTFAPRRPS